MAVNLKSLKRTGKGTPPAPAATQHNLEKAANGKTVPLQVNIAPEVKKQFRVYAAEREIDMSILFVSMWEYYKENHG